MAPYPGTASPKSSMGTAPCACRSVTDLVWNKDTTHSNASSVNSKGHQVSGHSSLWSWKLLFSSRTSKDPAAAETMGTVGSPGPVSNRQDSTQLYSGTRMHVPVDKLIWRALLTCKINRNPEMFCSGAITKRSYLILSVITAVKRVKPDNCLLDKLPKELCK